MDQRSRITLPEIVRQLGETRATIERLVARYEWRIGRPERFGMVRTWPAGVVEDLRAILAEEERLREVRS